MLIKVLKFTFHYVYIYISTTWSIGRWQIYLHSTMFIFIFSSTIVSKSQQNNLHSTMFIFILELNKVKIQDNQFTFHYVYIYIVIKICPKI